MVQPAAAPDFSFSPELRTGQHKGRPPRREPGLAQWDSTLEGPAHSRSQGHSDSEISSLPFSMASLTHNYTMQEFALQYFRKPQTL